MTAEPQGDGSWNLRGWYGPTTLWIGLLLASLIIDCFAFAVQGFNFVHTLELTLPESETLLAAVFGVAVLVVSQLIDWGIWALFVWRRWIHAGTKRRNYQIGRAHV